MHISLLESDIVDHHGTFLQCAFVAMHAHRDGSQLLEDVQNDLSDSSRAVRPPPFVWPLILPSTAKPLSTDLQKTGAWFCVNARSLRKEVRINRLQWLSCPSLQIYLCAPSTDCNGCRALVCRSISAPPQRSLRLCGGFAVKEVHRRVAESAEEAQRVELATRASLAPLEVVA